MLSGDTMYTWDHWSKLRASVCSAPLLSSRGMFLMISQSLALAAQTGDLVPAKYVRMYASNEC